MNNITATLDEAFGLSSFLSTFQGDYHEKLPPLSIPTGSSLLAWGAASVLVLMLLEQIKYRVSRIGQNASLPGKSVTHE
jgi:hypothetical protein